MTETRPTSPAPSPRPAPDAPPAESGNGITAIIARLEAATEGSWELDLEVGLARRHLDNGEQPQQLPPYTTSLDAALPWENITFVQRYTFPPHWTAYHSDADGSETSGRHPTSEAIARRIAALRARLAAPTQGEPG